MARILVVASLLVVVGAGCAGGKAASSKPVAATSEKTYEITLEPAPPLPKVLPNEVCFVGINDYDVTLLGIHLPSEGSCDTLADELFPGVPRLPWSPDEYLGPDAVDECTLSKGRARLQLMRDDPDGEGPRFARAEELTYDACARLRGEGWRPGRVWGE
jgi:hypothetical protein